MNKMYCPKCGKELINLIEDSDFVYHFWCDECLIDINIEENCPQPLEDCGDWDYNEDESFDPYVVNERRIAKTPLDKIYQQANRTKTDHNLCIKC